MGDQGGQEADTQHVFARNQQEIAIGLLAAQQEGGLIGAPADESGEEQTEKGEEGVGHEGFVMRDAHSDGQPVSTGFL